MGRLRAPSIVGWGALAAFCTLASPAAPPVMSPATQAGVWQRREIQFDFVGHDDSTYSCDWLKEKLALLLKSSGARPDYGVTSQCREFNRPAAGASAHLVFHALAPAAADDPHVTDSSGETRAAWRKVVLRDHSPLELRSMDCELVRQFRNQVLPLFTTRRMVDRSHCRPGENSPGDLDLQFEVLVAGAG